MKYKTILFVLLMFKSLNHFGSTVRFSIEPTSSNNLLLTSKSGMILRSSSEYKDIKKFTLFNEYRLDISAGFFNDKLYLINGISILNSIQPLSLDVPTAGWYYDPQFIKYQHMLGHFGIGYQYQIRHKLAFMTFGKFYYTIDVPNVIYKDNVVNPINKNDDYLVGSKLDISCGFNQNHMATGIGSKLSYKILNNLSIISDIEIIMGLNNFSSTSGSLQNIYKDGTTYKRIFNIENRGSRIRFGIGVKYDIMNRPKKYY